ncbi:hypothetical protein N0V90_005493 [Kalmusia sp. IMI 367209]|nr:hypothetical protein N0V90_005493 [Kalmusia sp. IMI 367209]
MATNRNHRGCTKHLIHDASASEPSTDTQVHIAQYRRPAGDGNAAVGTQQPQRVRPMAYDFPERSPITKDYESEPTLWDNASDWDWVYAESEG